MGCPICGAKEKEYLLKTETDDFDISYMYKSIRVCCCLFCEHIYNEVNPLSLRNLDDYYQLEACNYNANSPSKDADLPGSSSKLSTQRYDQLYKFIKPYLKIDSCILDLGCAKGGFIKYLLNKGHCYSFGIDFVKSYIDVAKKETLCRVTLGKAEKLPYPNDYFDFIIADQVFEHIPDIKQAISECYRVLKPNGYIYIGVPDAKRYSENKKMFPMFWFLLREHLHHFDEHHLNLLTHGKPIKVKRTNSKIMSDSMILPNLNVIYKKKKPVSFNIRKKYFSLKDNIKKYVEESNKNTIYILDKIIDTYNSGKTYFWGIGKEFLFLKFYFTKYLNNRAILIDGNEFKQICCQVEGRKILAPEFINYYDENSMVFITAVAHYKKIKKILKQNNYKGKIIKIW